VSVAERPLCATSGRSQKISLQLDDGKIFAISQPVSEPGIFAEARTNKGSQRSIASISLRATAVGLFDLDRHSTHARGLDRHVRKGHRRRKLSLHDSQLFDLATPLQAFRQTVECPNIIRVLCTPLNSSAQAQIVATDLLSLAVMALLGQQSCKRMPRWMHPCPRLDVLQIVVSIDCFPQMSIGKFMIAFVVFQLAIEHLLAHR
jgi:hypothetical protein